MPLFIWMNQDLQISKVETSLTALLGPPLNCSTASCVFLSAPHTPVILDSLNQHHAGEEQRLSQGLTPSTASAEQPLTYFVACPEVRILGVTTTADKRVKTLGVTHSNQIILPGYHKWRHVHRIWARLGKDCEICILPTPPGEELMCGLQFYLC